MKVLLYLFIWFALSIVVGPIVGKFLSMVDDDWDRIQK